MFHFKLCLKRKIIFMYADYFKIEVKYKYFCLKNYIEIKLFFVDAYFCTK